MEHGIVLIVQGVLPSKVQYAMYEYGWTSAEVC